MSAEQTVRIYKLSPKSELATKDDLEDLRAALVNKLNDDFKWTVATLLAVGAFIVALVKWY